MRSECNMQAPRVSAVITTYNRAHLLQRAIESVLTQDYPNLELIVVDDGSSDGTEALVRGYSAHGVRYLRHGRNRGLPAGRNTGIDAAEGEYVAFLDDDDTWLPSKIAKQIHAIGSRDAILCGVSVNGKYQRRYRKAFVSLRELRYGNRFPPSSLLARKHVLQELRFDETLSIGEDWDALIRLAERQPIVFLPDALVTYTENPLGMTVQARNQPISELDKRMAVIRKHEAFLGPFWTKYHTAGFLLSYLRHRSDKRRQVLYAARRCGWLAVGAALCEKAIRRIETV